ncbi:related to histone acetyltransferase [Cephalotrichum gorgonifer]|uniref:Histone acetyltransferase n=1 Tax=Cephalotrichum gorgonifer TaxID=2041049 RepID=A0AAE8SRE3_9PEZI|nr:related to histone acetyltransferase [Cephalotrichum gorgonifer]
MELTEEALQQSAASSGQHGAEHDRGARDYSASHTPNDHDRDDVEMTDRNEPISQGSGATAYDDDDDEDAEGEVDDDYEYMNGHMPPQTRHHEDDGASPEAAEENTDDEDEGVGAVKIRPGDTDDEDNGSEASAPTASEAESEEDAEWDGEEEVVVENDDEESDNAQSNNCIFCKESEENDPSEEFEAYLSCSGCAENAHQHCAREAGAISSTTPPSKWRCPECAADDDDDDDDLPHDNDDAISKASDTSAVVTDAQMPNADAIEPSEVVMGVGTPHPNTDPLDSDDDVTEGSRRLRKRKTPSVDGGEDVVKSLRKRRRQTTDERQLSQDGTPDEPQSARTLRIRAAPRQKAVDVSRPSPTSLVVTIRAKPDSIREALSQRYLPERKRSTNRASTARTPRANGARAREPSPESLIAPFVSTTYSQPFYSFFDKESDEVKGKPYGGILSEAEAGTSKTMPSNEDRRRFDEAKQRAEAEWKTRIIAMQEEIQMPAKKKKAAGPASQIECIEFGGWEIDTWYAAPYPEEYSRNRVLYICEFCLKYMNSDYVAWRHKLKCASKHPPGDEIYRHESVSVFEVDGRKNPVYCQNLCLLAKLFLGSKTLYYDVEPFLFYVLCEYDELGYHFVGYFSKEKRPSSQNNVSCILTLPIHQRKGYGNLLIDFSYLLTKAEARTGSPEKPLSDMGLVSYRNYWRLVMSKYMLEQAADEESRAAGLSIRKISEDTGMTSDDVISALEGLRCLVRDPQTKLYAFRVDLHFCREYVAKWESKNYVKLNPASLTWSPYVMGRSSALNFELGPTISAIAPREDDAESQPPEVEVLPDAGVSTASTNGHSNGHSTGAEDAKVESGEVVNGASSDDKENHPDGDLNGDKAGSEAEGQMNGSTSQGDKAWAAPYKDIPPIRFEVFPPVVGGRRVERARPILPERTVTTPRPRPSVSTSVSGSSRRKSSSSARPRSSTSRRKSGGTGRGPGRWPKGTKKSDYGNADSGPGLPPSWYEKRKDLAASQGGSSKRDGSNDDGKEMKDEVRVQVEEGGQDSVVVKSNRRSEALSMASAIEVPQAKEDEDDGEMDAEGEDE